MEQGLSLRGHMSSCLRESRGRVPGLLWGPPALLSPLPRSGTAS